MKDEVFNQFLLPLFTAAKPVLKQLIKEAWSEVEQEKERHADAVVRIQSGTRIGGTSLAKELTGYSDSTIYNKVSKGEIPVLDRDGGKLLFSESQLLEWISNGRPKNVNVADSVDNFLGKRKRRATA